MCMGAPTRSAAEWERETRDTYPEAARVIDRIIEVHHLCEDGKRIAWSSGRWIHDAIKQGLDVSRESAFNAETVY